MSKSVGIIGCGPSGLAAAKALKECGLKPFIFESSPRIGGLWAELNGKVPGTLQTNVSKYQCNFSDYPWPKQQQMFPSALEMEKYLQSYAEKYLTKDDISLNSEVHEIQPCKNDERDKLEWDVSYFKDSIKQKMKFEHIIIASGIFTKPFIPNLTNQNNFKGKVYHSSSSNEIKSNCKGKVVIVVGSSFSGAEACTDAIMFGAKKVIHICSKPFWILPKYVPKDPDLKSPVFLPLDFVLFQQDPTQGSKEKILLTKEENTEKNQFMRKIFKGQEILSPFLVHSDESPMYLVVSDSYAEFVRNETIEILSGKIIGFNHDSVILTNGEKASGEIVVFATGFQLNLSFLPNSQIEDYDPNDLLQPILLHKSMFHPSLPGIAFIGMYRGIYFGVIELQAKFIAAVMSGRIPWPSLDLQKQGQELELLIRNQNPKPQFPHSDYPGMAFEIAHELEIEPTKPDCDISVVIPAVFSNSDGAKDTLKQLHEDLIEAEQGRFLPPTIFRNLHGNWKFVREIESLLSSSPSGIVEGIAKFTWNFSDEYHYLEKGLFKLQESVQILEAKQEYLYKIVDNKLQVYFPDSRLFHGLEFCPGPDGWIGKGSHLCGEDLYTVEYQFNFEGAYLFTFQIKYQVKGPHKDYISKTTFSRI